MNGRGVGSCWRAVCLLEEGHLDACGLLVLGLAASCVHEAHVLMLCGSCVCVCGRCGELGSLPWLWKGKEESSERSSLFLHGHKAPPS